MVMILFQGIINSHTRTQTKLLKKPIIEFEFSNSNMSNCPSFDTSWEVIEREQLHMWCQFCIFSILGEMTELLGHY